MPKNLKPTRVPFHKKPAFLLELQNFIFTRFDWVEILLRSTFFIAICNQKKETKRISIFSYPLSLHFDGWKFELRVTASLFTTELRRTFVWLQEWMYEHRQTLIHAYFYTSTCTLVRIYVQKYTCNKNSQYFRRSRWPGSNWCNTFPSNLYKIYIFRVKEVGDEKAPPRVCCWILPPV